MKLSAAAIFLLLLFSCNIKNDADLLISNATIYTVDSAFSIAEAMVIKDGKVVETGKKAELAKKYDVKDTLDAEGKFIYPGFIDGHAHFTGYAIGLNELGLTNMKSWDEVLYHLGDVKEDDSTRWIVGRGWDQNDWRGKEFPTNEKLNNRNPIFLTRVDGHAAIANAKALELAGIKAGDKIDGGVFETKNGRLTGLLIDNAKDLVESKIPPPDKETLKYRLERAQQNCFAVGLTSVVDAGLDFETIDLIDQFQKEGTLKMRLYAMISDKQKNFDWLKQKGKIKTGYLNVRSVKMYGDGALGSRGACLLKDYTDKRGWKGFLLNSPAHFDSVAKICHDNGWQLCTHAIGDSSNRSLLHTYGRYLGAKNDLRWRIEHAQVVNSGDFHFFNDYSIVPSVQPTHATSDMYWAAERLGAARIKGAYAYLELLKQNNWLSLGTDFPVEDISPFKTFYAAVARKDAKGFPKDGFQTENALTREQTLRGMTIWAAKANFEENEKGSLEKGKFADFIILDKDLMKIPDAEILNIQVLRTFIGGNQVFVLKQ